MQVRSLRSLFCYPAALICCCLISATVLIGYVYSASDIPVANAGPGQTISTSQNVYLDGSKSTDPDGTPITYKWSFVSRPQGSRASLSQANTVMPTFTADVSGSYVVQLVVNNGLYSSTPATVTITTGNTPPVANAGPDQAVQVAQTVALDGSKSSDVNGNRLTYQWTFTSIPQGSLAAFSNSTAVTPSFQVDLPGTYLAQLIVNDGKSNSAPATATITTGNTTPVANAGPDQAVKLRQAVTLNGSQSYDADGDSITYQWSLLSIPSGSYAVLSNPNSVSPNFTIDVGGTYIAQLYVSDGVVNSLPDTVVISTSDTRPVASAGTAQAVGLGQGAVTLNGSQSYDAEGLSLTYKWAVLYAPSGSSAALSNTAAVKPTFTPDLAGEYVLQLIVSNRTLASAPNTVLITVSASQTTVPNVVGETTAVATSNITAANLVVGTITRQYSTGISLGNVISQSPVAGASVNQGTKVNLVVSLGPPQVSVPNVVGLTQASASSAITSAGLNVGSVTTQSSSTVAAGNVISESPSASTSVAQGSAVNLVVSLGPAMVPVPNVVGLTQANASSAITAAGLTVGTVSTQNSSTVATGNVISQSPSAGSSVAQGSAVSLVVSLGPVVATVPNVVGLTQANAATAITSAGLTVGTVTTQNSSVAAGDVISESPSAGTSVVPGSAVNLVVSLGPVMVTVPDVTGLTQASATSTLTSAGLTVGTVTTQSSSTAAAGDVISQSPSAGTSVSQGSTVSLVVSLGPAQSHSPPWMDTTTGYRRAVTVNNSTNSNTLSDYTVPIVLTSSDFDFSIAKSDGSDIRVTASDGVTLIPYWVQTGQTLGSYVPYNQSSQVGTIWVKVPSIPGSGTQTVYIYYGNASPAAFTVPPLGAFTKSSSNPFLSGTTILPENMVQSGSTYYILAATPNGDIYLLSSTDLSTWANAGTIYTPESDSNGPFLIQDGGTWYLFYMAGTYGSATIDYCTASAVTGPYTHRGTAISVGASGWDSRRVGEPYIIKTGSTYVMFYMGDSGTSSEPNEFVGYATASAITGPWTKWASNPISTTLTTPQASDPYAYYINGTYYLFLCMPTTNFADYYENVFTCYIKSTDLVNWTWGGTVLGPGNGTAWDSRGAFRGAISQFGNTYYFPYCGLNFTNLYEGGMATMSALSTASGYPPDQVFALYEDFSSSTLPSHVRGTQIFGSGGSASVSGGIATIQSGAAAGQFLLTANVMVNAPGWLMETSLKHSSFVGNSTTGDQEGWMNRTQSTEDFEIYTMSDAYFDKFSENGSNNTSLDMAQAADKSTYHQHRIIWNGAANVQFQNDSGATESITTAADIGSGPFYPYLEAWTETKANSSLLADYIFVRRYSSPEPSTSIGTAQSY